MALAAPVRVAAEGHLHQAAAILRHGYKADPAVGNLLRFPSFVVDTFDSAWRLVGGPDLGNTNSIEDNGQEETSQ